MCQPPGVPNEYFYFYSDVVEDFGLGISFTIFQSKLLKTKNVSPNKIHPNSWVFSRVFELFVGGSTSGISLASFSLFMSLGGSIKGKGFS